MQVIYPGPHTWVRILATGQLAERDHPVTVPHEVGVSLVEQGWKSPPVKKAAPAADKE